ncbi:diguanylate cyclase [Vibrio tubiashii]|uniref:diguanylate cyclase n=1 Tax=Vibrio tubiashii TaxID=29498 RepID=UPI0023D8F6BE|nr:diguanylate cyclase [Vibrio tubiashii]
MSSESRYKPSGFGISQKITIILLAVIMTSLVITGYVYHYKSQESIEQVVVDHLKTVVNNKKNMVYQVIKRYQERAALISSRTQLRLTLDKFNKTSKSEEQSAHIGKLYRIITDAQAPVKNIRDIIIATPNGRIVTSSSDIDAHGTVQPHLLPVEGKLFSYYFTHSIETGTTTLYVTQQLNLDRKMIGFVILEMNLNDFSAVTNTQFGLGSSEETTLVYRDPDSLSVTPIYPEALALGYDQNTWVNPFTLVREKDDDVSTYTDHRNRKVLAVAHTFKELNLGLVYKIDHTDALGIIDEQKHFLLVSSLVTALFGGIAVLVLSRKITKPIIDITYVASMIASGDLSQRIRYFTKDELGMLAQAFNQMADKLIDANQILEQRVSEKTRELFQANENLAKLNRDLELLSLRDSLTGIANRRAFDSRLKDEWKRCHRDQTHLGLILIDIDYFKKYNDSLGHNAGDACLKQVANILDRSVGRDSDLVARYGGEEFALLLPNTSLTDALTVANAIQTMIQHAKITHPDSPISSHITLSIGVGAEIPERELPSIQYVEQVDAALYLSKGKGRNQISTINEL